MKNLSTFNRLKQSVPFSERLNDWIVSHMETLVRTGQIDGIDYTDDEGYDTLENITKYYNDTHRLMIWQGASDNTIFGDPKVNLLFRAWHDYEHIVNQFPFTTEGESMTAFKQIAQLPQEWGFEQRLILTEVIGQVLYNHYHNGAFPVDQRRFAVGYMQNGDITVKY